MKSVGIVTFHRARNYGAMLQAYALQEALNERFTTRIVDYRSGSIEDMFYGVPVSPKLRVKRVVKGLVYRSFYRSVRRKNDRFDDFQREYFQLDGPYTEADIERTDQFYDAFVVGSDQVWNTRLTKGDLNYFLKFADPRKRYSYAASFGSGRLDGEELRGVREELCKFQSLLVREWEGEELIRSLGIGGLPINVTLDPVFLLSRRQWIDKMSLKKSSGGYALVYIVAHHNRLIDFANRMREETGVEMVYLNHFGRTNTCPQGFREVVDVGPREFLQLILNARYVLTTSFHATAFSLIFHIPFYYELDVRPINNNSRITHLADIFGIGTREVTGSAMHERIDPDWLSIDRRIALLADESRDRLFCSLGA